MIYIFLFETKSIQSYLNRTGKLKDLIAISDRLGTFIDDGNDSVLEKVLNAIGNVKNSEDEIKFIRRRGGSFYAYCKKEEPLKRFKQLWLLVFYQYFPYMSHTEYFGEIKNQEFKQEIKEAFKLLSASINDVKISMPYATSVVDSAPNTGCAAISHECDHKCDLLQFRLDKFAAKDDETATKRIYKKFISAENSQYDDELIKKFIQKFRNNSQNDSKDIAYLHFDGNGIGQQIIKLRDEQPNLETYTQTLTQFSQSLADATLKAARKAFDKIYNEAGNKVFAFRPLVLGGDDLTVMIDPKYAFEFAINYTKEFQRLTKNIANCKNGLTASGGILFNKINHPATNTGALVEALAEKAKNLTKNSSIEELKGKATVAFYRMSTTTTQSFDSVMAIGRIFECKNKKTNTDKVCLGRGAYFIEDNCKTPSIETFKNFLAEVCKEKDTANYVSVIPTFRMMMSEIAQGKFYEAERLYNRLTIERNDVPKNIKEVIFKFFNLMSDKESREKFYYLIEEDNKKMIETPLADLLVMHHYVTENSEEGDQ